MENWRIKHAETIEKFLKYLNRNSDDYILKGGTSLMMCYNLDRFSEDIDLDCVRSKQIKTIVNDFCNFEKFTYRIAKDTDTVKRFMINYGNESKPLKIEVSYRKKVINPDEYTTINGIKVYTIENICAMKVNAYSSRDRIRDLYDLTFICNKYWDALPSLVKNLVSYCVEYKGLEQFDYLIKTQSDELIDNDKLASDFLEMYDRLGLLIDAEEPYYINVSKTEFNELQKNFNFTSDEYRLSNDDYILKLNKRKADDVKKTLSAGNFKNFIN